MSRPIHGEESVTVSRSPGAVWSVVADYGTDTAWRKGLTDMTADPPGAPAIVEMSGTAAARRSGVVAERRDWTTIAEPSPVSRS